MPAACLIVGGCESFTRGGAGWLFRPRRPYPFPSPGALPLRPREAAFAGAGPVGVLAPFPAPLSGAESETALLIWVNAWPEVWEVPSDEWYARSARD